MQRLAFSALLLAIAACGDDLVAPPPFPWTGPCTQFVADMRGVDDDEVIPSIAPADLGVRIIVDADFDPLMGASVAVPGGRMVWSVWVYRWFDGDHLGAIGRVPDAGVVPRGGMCQWYDPL